MPLTISMIIKLGQKYVSGISICTEMRSLSIYDMYAPTAGAAHPVFLTSGLKRICLLLNGNRPLRFTCVTVPMFVGMLVEVVLKASSF